MEQVNLLNSKTISFRNEHYNSVPDPSSPSQKPAADHYGENKLLQNAHHIPSWQELEPNFDWRLPHQKMEFTFNSKDLAVVNNLTKMMKEHKVYHQPYDICPVRRKSRWSYSSKSCEPHRSLSKNEASQTDFEPTYGYSALRISNHMGAHHNRRPSSLDNKNPNLNFQSDLYAGHIHPNTYQYQDYNVMPGYSSNMMDNYQYMAAPVSKNIPDSASKEMRDYFDINNSNSSTRDSAAPVNRISREEYIGKIHNNGNTVRNDYEYKEGQGIQKKIDPKILIIEGGDSYGPGVYQAPFVPDRNEFSRKYSKEADNEYSKSQEKGDFLSDNYSVSAIPHYFYSPQSYDESNFNDPQQSDKKPTKKDIKIETTDSGNIKGKALSNSKMKFIGDIDANKVNYYKEDEHKDKLYSNHNIMDIKTLLTPNLLKSLDSNPNVIIIEGELMKYKPGLNFSYVKRWVQITKNEFRYYASRFKANTWDTTPLLIIPFKDIKGVYRVNLKLPKQIKKEGTSKGVQKSEPKLYHFEIFTENHPLPFLDELDVSIHTNTSALKDKSILSPEYTARETNRSHLTNRVDASSYQAGYLEKNHLMLPPRTRKRETRNYDLNIPNNCDYEEYSSNLLSGSMFNSKLDFLHPKDRPMTSQNGISKDLQGRTGLNRKNGVDNSGLPADRDKTILANKESSQATYHYVKNIEDYSSWTGRHKEWYYSEKRLLFSTISSREREIWISVINWLIESVTKAPYYG